MQTKLYIPPLRPNLVPRPQLLERLNQGLQLGHKLTLVSAPAGFGKTTLISDWVNTLDHPVTWRSLDAGDDDPGRFFAYLVAALQKVDPNLGREIGEVLRSGQIPPGEIISTILVNDILEVEDLFQLIVDDFHLIQDRLIFQVLEHLVANLPPALHLVLITREDPPLPLARLRANQQMSEIRARELRFTGHDTDCFLYEVLGLSLSKTDVAILEDKTEGWIAGLQLAGLSIQDQADPSSLVAALSGSHRLILSYLTEQVLDQQPEEIRHFLLQTAILDRVNGDLCNAVTGLSDSRVMLERLFKANLFLISLDEEGQWYRYHHLFADLLRDRQNALRNEKTAVLHQRASRWYSQAGMAREAIKHALAAADHALAVELLESHAMHFIMRGYVKTVNNWMQAVPGQWQSQSPKTTLAFAWMHLLRGAYAEASPYLERLEAYFSGSQVSEEERRSLKAEWLVMRSLILLMEGKTTDSLAAANEALATTLEQDSRVRSLAYFGLASAFQAAENDELAMDAYETARQHGRAADNLVAEMLSTSGLAVMAYERGQLHLACEIATQVSDRIEHSGLLPPISAVIYGVLGEVYYQWGQTEQARRHNQRALQLSTLGGYKSSLINCRVQLSRLSQFEGDLESASHEIREAIDQLQVDTPDYVRQEAVSQQVCVYLARNRSSAAQMALQGHGFSFRDQFIFPDLPLEQSFTHENGLLYNSGLRILLHQARAGADATGLRQGIALAERLLARARQGQYVIVVLEALLLRAQMHAVLGDHQASREDYLSALQLAEAEGFIGVFVEQGQPVAEALARLVQQERPATASPDSLERILKAFARLRPPDEARSASFLVEPLSEREMDVLRLMAGGLKYKEIATRLFISLNTVRFHVKAIYRKLNVNNRTQAIETARQLQIL